MTEASVNTARPELAGPSGKLYSCQPRATKCLHQLMSIKHSKNHRAQREASSQVLHLCSHHGTPAPSLSAFTQRARHVPPTLSASQHGHTAFLPSLSKAAHPPAPSAKQTFSDAISALRLWHWHSTDSKSTLEIRPSHFTTFSTWKKCPKTQ